MGRAVTSHCSHCSAAAFPSYNAGARQHVAQKPGIMAKFYTVPSSSLVFSAEAAASGRICLPAEPLSSRICVCFIPLCVIPQLRRAAAHPKAKRVVIRCHYHVCFGTGSSQSCLDGLWHQAAALSPRSNRRSGRGFYSVHTYTPKTKTYPEERFAAIIISDLKASPDSVWK